MRLTNYFDLERQEALEEGIQLGRQQAIEEGIQLGRQQALEEGIQLGRQKYINFVFRLSSYKFGEIPLNLRERISQLSFEQLESLSDALLHFEAVSDLENWLN